MKLVDTLLTWVDRLLQVLVPPIPNRISYVSFPDYTDNAFYVFWHAVRTREGLEHVWLVRDLSLRERIERDFNDAVGDSGTRGNVLRVEARATLQGYFHFLRSKFVFHTHGAYRFRTWAWRRIVVCLWHGMPIKCIGLLNRVTPNPYPTFGTMHLATSRFFQDIIARAFGVDPTAVRLCGLPRCDALQHGSAQTSGAVVRARLGVADGQRLVLWMPTYRTEGASPGRTFLDDLPEGALDSLDRAAAAANAVVITKLHPLDPLNNEPPQWPGARVRLLSAAAWSGYGIQLYDLIAASDALISDVSSCLIDYLVTNRPVGILGFDAGTYTRELILPFERLTGTGRFQLLGTPSTYESFLRETTAPARSPAPTFLYDTFTVPGSEQILRELGL